MLNWISNNWGSILVVAVIICILALIIVKMISDKKKGKSTCGHGCANCAMYGKCHEYTSK